MGKILFENEINAAAPDYPYMNFRVRDLNYAAHLHQEIELMAVAGGNITVTCGRTRISARKGDICVFMPGEIHSVSSEGDILVYVVKINSKHSVEKINFSGMSLPGHLIPSGSEPGRILWEKLHQACEETERRRPGYAYAVNGLANECICALLRSGLLRQVSPREEKRHLAAAAMLEEAEYYIKAHYTEPVRLADAAAQCGYSHYYFAHFFKEVAHITFFEYLTRYRLEQAVKLLLYSGEKMESVAERAGFANVRSFNREFKKMFGQTPSDYKKGNRAAQAPQ